MIQEKLLKAFDLYKEKTVIKYQDIEFSYKELERMSKKITNMIIEKEYGDIVAIYSRNSLYIIASIIGILLSRRTFVILSHDDSSEYNNGILKELKCKDILDDSMEYGSYSSNLREMFYEPEDSIYIYPTSGSTGTPKLVVGKNKGLEHFTNWQISEFKINSYSKFLRLISYTHDAVLRDIFTPICSGGEIVCLDSVYDIFETKKIQEFIAKNNITHLHCTPSMIKIIISKIYFEDSFKSITNIFLSGEEVVSSDIKKMLKYNPKIKFVNLYGPTEMNMVRLFYRICKEDLERGNIPIGTPIWDTFYKIIPDEEGNNILYLSSEYGTHGYYKDKKNESFKILEDGRLYFNTGDIVEETDEKLYYIGRKDCQIKIRGNRVNLNEIRIRIEKLLPSSSITVFNHNLNDIEKIYAFIKDENTQNTELLKQRLLDLLPSYMVPNRIIQVYDFPLTKNGKLDRKKLIETYIKEYKIDKKTTNKETILKELWKSILNINYVEYETDFFLQGADSLSVVRLMVELDFYGFSIETTDIFKKRKFKAILETIKTNEKEKENITSGKLDFLSIQKQIIKVNQVLTIKNFWNMINIFELKIKVNTENLKQLIKETIFASDIFKIRVSKDNKIEISSTNNIKIDSIDFENKDIKLDSMISIISELNIYEGFLGEVLIFENKNRQLICWNFHHLVFDNKSMDIIIRRLNNLLKHNGVSDEKSYIDFMKERNAEINSDINYWLNRGVEKYNFELSEIKRSNIFEPNPKIRMKKTVYDEYSTFMVFVAALSIAIYNNTGNEKVGFHTFLDIRNQYSSKNTVGLFTHEAIILNEVNEDSSCKEILDNTRNEIMNALENHRYDKNQLLGTLMNRNSIIINYEKDERIEDNLFKKIYTSNMFSNYSILIEVKEYDEFIDVNFIFKDKKTKENTGNFLITDTTTIYEKINTNMQKKNPRLSNSS